MYWCLPSNSGRFQARWQVTASADGCFTVDFKLLGQSYNRLDALRGDTALEVLLRGLQVRQEALSDLAASLRDWLSLPLAKLRDTELRVDAEMGGRFDEWLRLSFGPDSNVIADGHPVARLTYTVAGATGEVAFKCDQSCIREFENGLHAALNGNAASQSVAADP